MRERKEVDWFGKQRICYGVNKRDTVINKTGLNWGCSKCTHTDQCACRMALMWKVLIPFLGSHHDQVLL